MSAHRRRPRADRPALTVIAVMAGLLASASMAMAAPTVTTQAGVGPIPAIAGASSSPRTVAQCRKKFKHKKKARIACEKHVRHKKPAPKGGSGCTLEARYSTQGEAGDTKDLKVGFKAVGSGGPNEPATIQVEVKVLNPKVTLCNTSLEVLEFPSGTEHTTPVPLGPHGGTSEPITVPANAIPSVKAVARSG